MKSAKSIIEHIIKQPSNKKLLEKKCFERIKNALPTHLSNAIEFVYLKNQTLFFVLNHPGMKMEFNYKHNLIKSLLKKLQDIDTNCKEIQVSDVKSFVTNKAYEPKEVIIKRYYSEKSSGSFTIKTDNEDIKNAFLNIQKEIEKINETRR